MDFDRSGDFGRGGLRVGGDEHVDVVGHDLYLLQRPSVCGAGLGYGVAACDLDFSGEYLVPVFGAEDDMVAEFIDLVTVSFIPPATPAIVKTIRQLAKTGVSAPIMALAAFTLLGVGLMLFRRRGNQTETARHRK